MKAGKNIKAAREAINKEAEYELSEAIKILKDKKYTKFDSTLDIVIKLGVDPRHSNEMVRGVVAMPAGTGKQVKVAVICADDKVEIAKSAGADLAGNDNIIDEIKSGKINFDVCVATPDMMGKIGQVARILGPKGLMPNPKLGTVTPNIEQAVKSAKAGQVEYRVEKAGIIHAGIGKLSFEDKALKSNVDAIYGAVAKAKPTGLKGTYMKGVYLSSTMGPAIKIKLASLAA